MKAPVLFALLAAPMLLAACETTKTTTVMAPEGSAVVAKPGAVVATSEGTVTTPTTVAVVPAANDTCTAASYQALVGQKSPAISVPAGTEFRHYRTGDAITMDHNPSRLNFEYNRSGTLVKVTCG